MDILINVVIFTVALAVLLKASDLFVDAAEIIGLAFGIPHFIIGVTIVAFGTSLPELATSIDAVLVGESSIVVGSVIGSNITNIALVLGLVAIYAKKIELEYNIWHVDMPFLWGSAFIMWFVLYDYYVSPIEIFILLTGLVLFLAYSLKKPDDEKEEKGGKPKVKIKAKTWGLLLLGAIFIFVGAHYTIYAISELSTIAGVSPDIIALSAIALGTSLPEVIVSLNAAKKGNTAMALGNVLGSNIFNTYAVMSIPAFFGKLIIPEEMVSLYLPMMIVMTILFGIMANNKKITRWEGALLLLFYLLYASSLVQKFL